MPNPVASLSRTDCPCTAWKGDQQRRRAGGDDSRHPSGVPLPEMASTNTGHHRVWITATMGDGKRTAGRLVDRLG
jgi:hypothetical protein